MSTQRPSSSSDVPELPIGEANSDPVFVESSPSPGGREERRSAISEDFSEQLNEAEEELLALRQREEEAKRRKQEIEELRRKQERFLKGRVEVSGRLEKALSRLDRETFQAKKRLEMVAHVKDSFTDHLQTIDALKPETWPRERLLSELVKATAELEAADQEYFEAMAQLGLRMRPLGDEEEEEGMVQAARDDLDTPRERFIHWLLVGCAVSLPFAFWAIVVLVLFLIFGS